MTECGDGIHSPESCEWGDWLLVQFDNGGGHGNSNVPRGGGSMGRGGGFGRGRGNPGDPNDRETEDMDLGDAIIPMARKRLIGQDGSVLTPAMSTPPAGYVHEKVNLIENVNKEPVDKNLLSTPQKVHDSKRLKEGSGMVNNTESSPSATSLWEDRSKPRASAFSGLLASASPLAAPAAAVAAPPAASGLRVSIWNPPPPTASAACGLLAT